MTSVVQIVNIEGEWFSYFQVRSNSQLLSFADIE